MSTETTDARRHLRFAYGLTLCRLAHVEVSCWPKGSTPTEADTCPECWRFYAAMSSLFGDATTRP